MRPRSVPTTTATSDDELVRRARGGELGAFGELVDRHRDVVVRVAARIVGPGDAEDVAQDAFLRAFHRLGRLKGDAQFRPWLLRITHNASLDQLDRRARVARAEATEEEVDEVAELRERSPARLIEARERRDRLARKLQLLRPEHRAVLVLRDLEGLPYEEIAEVTEMPLGSVKGRLHRARGELIEILRANAYDWELPDEE